MEGKGGKGKGLEEKERKREDFGGRGWKRDGVWRGEVRSLPIDKKYRLIFLLDRKMLLPNHGNKVQI